VTCQLRDPKNRAALQPTNPAPPVIRTRFVRISLSPRFCRPAGPCARERSEGVYATIPETAVGKTLTQAESVAIRAAGRLQLSRSHASDRPKRSSAPCLHNGRVHMDVGRHMWQLRPRSDGFPLVIRETGANGHRRSAAE
jgi:hypothetical protein